MGMCLQHRTEFGNRSDQIAYYAHLFVVKLPKLYVGACCSHPNFPISLSDGARELRLGNDTCPRAIWLWCQCDQKVESDSWSCLMSQFYSLWTSCSAYVNCFWVLWLTSVDTKPFFRRQCLCTWKHDVQLRDLQDSEAVWFCLRETLPWPFPPPRSGQSPLSQRFIQKGPGGVFLHHNLTAILWYLRLKFTRVLLHFLCPGCSYGIGCLHFLKITVQTIPMQLSL